MEMDDNKAVTILSSIPNQPINPKMQNTAKTSGKLPINPAGILLKIMDISKNIATKANSKE